MRIKLLLVSICVLFTQTPYAQNIKLKGSVTDNNLNKVSGATIVLINKSDSSILTTAISDTNGFFSLTSNGSKESELNINHVSYKTQSFNIPIKCDSTLTVCMEELNYRIEDVTVVGKGKPIRIKDDGSIVVSMESIAGYETQNTTDLLKKLPGVFTSPSEGLVLNGLPVTILVDGKESKMDLSAIPASIFNDAELISNPSAEYDASTKAVINLVTKRNRTDGIQSYIGVNGTINRIGQIDGNGNYTVMLKKKNIYFNNSLGYNSYSFFNEGSDSTYYKDNGNKLLSKRKVYESAKRIMNNANVIWVMKHNQELNANLYIFAGIERNKDDEFQTFSQNPTETYKHTNKPTVLFLSTNLEYKTGDNLPFKLKASYGFSAADFISRQTMDVIINNQPNFGYTQAISPLDLQHTVKVDYSQSFNDNKLNLKAGALDNIISSNYKNTYDILYGTRPLENTTYSSIENVAAAYASLYYTPIEKLSFYFAGRIEHTYYHILSNITSGMSTGGTSSRSYFNFMPYASVTYKPSDVYTGSLVFSTALTRPNFSLLMPGVIYESDYSYSVGNHTLSPKYNYTVSLKNTFLQSFYFNINGLYDKNMIVEIMKKRENNVTETTYENCIDKFGISANIGVPFRFFKEKFTGQLNFTGEVGRYTNPKEEFVLLSDRENSYSFNSSLYLDYQITDRFSLNGYVDYFIKEKSLQVNTDGYAGLDLGAQYSFLKDKSLTLSVYAQDIFNTREIRRNYYYDNIFRSSYNSSSSQVFIIGLSYKFGRGENVDKGSSRNLNDTSRIF